MRDRREVGKPNVGKSTLFNLILRYFDSVSGRILIDGVDITEYSRNDLRSLYGMVLQDTWLFNGTIKEILFSILYPDIIN